jgi:3-hydroxyisobutyrate dehydrogenase-like beta-hydroxyacid dehydrogenase
MQNELHIGFVGLGEAGSRLASGLRSVGIKHLAAYDLHTHTPGRGERIQARAAENAVTLCASPEGLAADSEVILSVVTASSAVEAAAQIAPYLSSQHLYADLNSVSPETKRTVGQIVSDTGARFVEVAVMAPVPPLGHKVPMLLGGEHAAAFVSLFAPYGLQLEIVSAQIGSAVAVKMCRSVVVKGLEALLFECVLGATKYGVDERVFASLEASWPGMNWSKLAGYCMGRVLEHGERRARELEEVAATLRAAGIEPLMAEAIVKRQDWGAQLGLLAQFEGKLPNDYATLAEAIESVHS